MAKLPFVVQPRRQPITERIGDEDSGIIEIERRGYLSTGEKAFVQQVQQLDGGTSEIITVSRRVARKYAMSMDRAYNMVLAIIAGISDPDEKNAAQIEEIEREFADDLTKAIKEMSAGQVREEMIMAACMLKYRVDPDFEINDIAALHPELITGLANLYRDEDRRSIEAFKAAEKDEAEQAKPSIEEAEKKPAKTRASRSSGTIGD